MSVLPPGYHGGTTLAPSITSYDTLAARVKRLLGAPLINLEIADEQMYEYITDSIEYFTKWAGYTEEYLVFDSKLYVKGLGIKMDDLINRTPEMMTSTVSGLSAVMDYDLASYRKVIDIFEFAKGEDTGINTLFTLEQAMANNIYSSYMLGNFGFDLITWETLKGFIDTRKKVLAQEPRYIFDPRKQLLRLIPEPIAEHTYLGVVGCYIERPIKELISERWVLKYTTALTKIGISRTREKFSGMSMFGGGQINAANLLQEGLKEKDELEKEIQMPGPDTTASLFFLG